MKLLAFWRLSSRQQKTSGSSLLLPWRANLLKRRLTQVMALRHHCRS